MHCDCGPPEQEGFAWADRMKCQSCRRMQVTHSYGDKSNEMLLQFYGFVEMNNINDIYMADMYEWTKQRHNVSEERWHFLESDPLVMQALHQASTLPSAHFYFWLIFCTNQEPLAQARTLRQMHAFWCCGLAQCPQRGMVHIQFALMGYVMTNYWMDCMMLSLTLACGPVVHNVYQATFIFHDVQHSLLSHYGAQPVAIFFVGYVVQQRGINELLLAFLVVPFVDYHINGMLTK